MKEQKRNLAFYKEDGTPWTLEEYNNIMTYTADNKCSIHSWKVYNNNLKYIYDDESTTYFMHMWDEQNEDYINECTKLSYEAVFNTMELVSEVNLTTEKVTLQRFLDLEKQVKKLNKVVKKLKKELRKSFATE